MPTNFSRAQVLKSNGRAGGWIPQRAKLSDWHIEKRLGDVLKSAVPVNPRLNRNYYPIIRDQGELGSCTGQGSRSALMYHVNKYGHETENKHFQDFLRLGYDLSPLALYYYGREAIKLTREDSGAVIRDVIDACRKYGAPREDAWPYKISRFKTPPSTKAKITGKWHQGINTYQCDGRKDSGETVVNNILHSIVTGMPIVFGFPCFDNLAEADNNGVIPMPTKSSKEEGGHCMAIFEADTASRYFIGPNSWSDEWGATIGNQRGNFLLPFAYFLEKMADDVWSIDLENR